MNKESNIKAVKQLIGLFRGGKSVISRGVISSTRNSNQRLLELYQELERLKATGVRGDRYVSAAREIGGKIDPITSSSAASISENLSRLARKHPFDHTIGLVDPPGRREAWRAFANFGERMASKNPYDVLNEVKRMRMEDVPSAAFESGWKRFASPLTDESLLRSRKIDELYLHHP